MSEEFYGFDDADFDDEQEYDGDDEAGDDCGFMRGMNHEPLGCGKAGSEECDWECPYRDEVERIMRAQYAAKCRWAKAKAKPTASSTEGASSQLNPH